MLIDTQEIETSCRWAEKLLMGNGGWKIEIESVSYSSAAGGVDNWVIIFMIMNTLVMVEMEMRKAIRFPTFHSNSTFTFDILIVAETFPGSEKKCGVASCLGRFYGESILRIRKNCNYDWTCRWAVMRFVVRKIFSHTNRFHCEAISFHL